jgi:ADP-ribose pyrophosphatase
MSRGPGAVMLIGPISGQRVRLYLNRLHRPNLNQNPNHPQRRNRSHRAAWPVFLGEDKPASKVQMNKVKIKRRQRILDDFFKIEEAYLSYERFDGQMSDTVRRLNFERGDSVAAIIFNTDTQQVVLVNQFRYPTFEKGPGWIIEAIAGIVEGSEAPETAIRREVLEETGYKVSELRHISTFYVSPGGSSERILLYYAEVNNADKVAAGGGLSDEREDIQILEWSLPEVIAALTSGKIADAKTLIGLMWLQHKLQQRQ